MGVLKKFSGFPVDICGVYWRYFMCLMETFDGFPGDALWVSRRYMLSVLVSLRYFMSFLEIIDIYR